MEIDVSLYMRNPFKVLFEAEHATFNVSISKGVHPLGGLRIGTVDSAVNITVPAQGLPHFFSALHTCNISANI